MHIPWFQHLLLQKSNFPGKPGSARSKFYLQKQSLDTILTLIQVYIVISLLLALLQGVYICAHPVISTAVVTLTQFSKKTRKCWKQILFSEIKPLYHSNFDSSLYCHNFTVSTFPVGLHLCSSCDFNSCCYTNPIFQECQEVLEANCICRNKALIPF